MRQEEQYLLTLIKYTLNHRTKDVPFPEENFDWEVLYRCAKRHSVLSLVYYGIEHLPKESRPTDEVEKRLYQFSMREVMRNYNQTDEIEKLLKTFEEEKLYVLPVKGVCTKRHYPQPDMRSMGDIDVLCKASQQGKLKKVMVDLGYDYEAEGRKHDHYSMKPYMNLEMHRELVETDSKYSSYYKTVWDRVQKREGCTYICEMTLEDEYIYNLIHLVEHFQNGGIGIRFVMDVFLYDQMEQMNWDYVRGELRSLGLLEFYSQISSLAKRWFAFSGEEKEEEPDVIDKMEAYVMDNGTFGNQKNEAAISVAKGGKVRFLLRAVFPNLENMKSMFPWLEKWPILLPISWVIRGVRSILFRRGNIKVQLDKYRYGNQEYGQELQAFFKDCGL